MCLFKQLGSIWPQAGKLCFSFTRKRSFRSLRNVRFRGTGRCRGVPADTTKSTRRTRAQPRLGGRAWCRSARDGIQRPVTSPGNYQRLCNSSLNHPLIGRLRHAQSVLWNSMALSLQPPRAAQYSTLSTSLLQGSPDASAWERRSW